MIELTAKYGGNPAKSRCYISPRKRARHDETLPLRDQILQHRLDRLVVFEEPVADLRKLLTSLEYVDQQSIVLAGGPKSGAQLLIRGRARVQDAIERHLYEYEAGAAIKAPSAIHPQQAHASRVAEGPCETLLVTPQKPRSA